MKYVVPDMAQSLDVYKRQLNNHAFHALHSNTFCIKIKLFFQFYAFCFSFYVYYALLYA